MGMQPLQPQQPDSRSGSTHEVDQRRLPIPEPYDKHDAQVSRNRRHQDEWSWESWRTWMRQFQTRTWCKSQICCVLKMRHQDPANRGVDLHPDKTWNQGVWIYALYHFATGRWYVGQTVRRFWLRAQEQYGQAKKDRRLTDVLHTALANEPSPFSFVVFPLEKIAYKDYHRGGLVAVYAIPA